MKDYLRSLLREALLKAFDLEEAEIPDIEIEKPNQPEHGDAAANIAMQMAGKLNDNPRNIARKIVGAMDYSTRRVAAVEIAGPGFINFRYADAWLYDELDAILEQGADFGRNDLYGGKRALVEFVSANPTGPLTVGHGRNAVLGDTIARLLEWSGADVEREYYFNDAGRQMRLLGESVRARYLQELGREAELPEDGYEGTYITDIARSLAEERGEELAGIENLEPFKEKAKEIIFGEIRATLGRMNIEMDHFFNEGDLYEDGSIDHVLEAFREKDLAYESDGAVWMRTTAFGKEKDTVLVKSSGEPTYRLPDIAYHADKLERGFDLYIDVFGADHIDTFPDVLSGVESLGYDASKVDVVVYQFVTIVKEGKPYKMSTRKANFVTLDELMEEVGADVARFFFLMRAPNTHLEFDIAEAKEAGEKNPVFYLQYAHARIQSILRKVGEEYTLGEETSLERLEHPSEIRLIKSMIRFPELVRSAAESREPHRLISYLNDLASHFTAFYHDCRILGEEAELARARTRLAEATAAVLANGLTILGISAPDQM